MKGGHEPFHDNGVSIGATLQDCWRWSNSDLLSNVGRGVMAEFLIARALDVAHEPRVEWVSWDLRTSSGVTVEVKSAAYAQAWPQERPSDIRFDIAPRKQVWEPSAKEFRDLPEPQRPADVYVFCALGRRERTASDTDPRDVAQWAFFVIATAVLDRECPRQKTIGIRPLRSFARAPGQDAAEVEYGDLAAAVEAAAPQRDSLKQ